MDWLSFVLNANFRALSWCNAHRVFNKNLCWQIFGFTDNVVSFGRNFRLFIILFKIISKNWNTIMFKYWFRCTNVCKKSIFNYRFRITVVAFSFSLPIVFSKKISLKLVKVVIEGRFVHRNKELQSLRNNCPNSDTRKNNWHRYYKSFAVTSTTGWPKRYAGVSSHWRLFISGMHLYRLIIFALSSPYS